MNLLDEIFIKYGTDKSSHFHNYGEAYFLFFEKLKRDPLRILEIGVLNGASTRSWAEFFENSQIIGVDANPDCMSCQEGRISIEIGDQLDKNLWDRLQLKYNGFDIIIDDGGHTWRQQKGTFRILFENLNPGGYYVIEDISTSYLKGSVWDTNEETTVEFLKTLLDDLNFNGKSICGALELKSEELNEYECWIESMYFFKGICIIKKRNKKL